MAAQRRYVARERNEIGLTNFVDSLRSLFIQVQQINTAEIDSEYLETTRSHLESAINSVQLLLVTIGETQDSTLQDFRVILEVVLRQSRTILEIIVVLESQNLESTTASFACPTAALQGPGRPALIVQREQIEFLRELHFPWTKIARILGISDSTLRRRREELQLRSNDFDDQNFSELSGSYLNELLLKALSTKSVFVRISAALSLQPQSF